MIEAYKIGVSLVMETNVNGVIGKLMSEFEKLNKVIKDTQTSVTALSKGLRGLAGAIPGLDKVAASINKINSATNNAASSASSAESAARNYTRNSSGASDGDSSPGTSLVPSPRLLGYSGGAGGMVSAPLMLGYDGASIVGGFPSSGALVPSPLMLSGPRSGAVPPGWSSWTPSATGYNGGAGGSGGLAVGGGGGVGLPPLGGFGGGGGIGLPPLNYTPPQGPGPLTGLSIGALVGKANTAFYVVDRLVEGIAHLIEKADKFNDSLVALEQRGVRSEDIHGLERLMMDLTAKTPGTTLGQVGADIGSLRAVMGESDGYDRMQTVKDLLPHAEQVFSAMIHDGKALSEGDRHLLFRAIELGGGATDSNTGHISSEKFNASLDAVYAVLTAAGNVVGPRDLLNMSQQGAVMAKAMGDFPAFLRMMIAPLIDMKGSRAGTALQAAGRQFFGGTMTKEKAYELARILGLHDKDDFEGKDGAKRLKPTLMEKLGEDMKGGLLAFIEKDIKPGMVAKGITSPEEQNKELFKLAGTDTLRRLMSLFITNSEQVAKEQHLMDEVPDVANAMKLLSDKSIGFNITAMTAQAGNLLDVMEKASAGGINSATQAVTEFLKTLTSAADILSHFSPSDKRFWIDPNLKGATPGMWPLKDIPSLPGPRANPDKQSFNQPIYVHVANASDIGRGMIGSLSDGAARPQSGPNFQDYRFDMPQPGMSFG